MGGVTNKNTAIRQLGRSQLIAVVADLNGNVQADEVPIYPRIFLVDRF